MGKRFWIEAILTYKGNFFFFFCIEATLHHISTNFQNKARAFKEIIYCDTEETDNDRIQQTTETTRLVICGVKRVARFLLIQRASSAI